jgi:BspA type Leucine rich repeat region (6 copies)
MPIVYIVRARGGPKSRCTWGPLDRTLRVKGTMFALLGVLLLARSAQAQFALGTNADDTINIIGYTGSSAAVTIPNATNGLKVTTIGTYAFAARANRAVVTSVTIPGTVTSIGDGAFQACGSLSGITIPGSVTNIGFAVFAYAGLTNITIPGSLTNVGNQTFIGCTNLMAIAVETQNPSYTSVNGVLLNKAQTTLIQYPGGIKGGYAVPSTVTSIGDHSFAESTNLTSIIISGNVTNIGFGAFADSGLRNVTVLGGVTGIQQAAFYGCGRLTSVFFNGNAPTVGLLVFTFDNKATAYYLQGTTGWSDFAFYAGIPTVLWNPQVQTGDTSFGAQNNQFGFNITGTTNIPIVVEACTNLVNPVWIALQTLTLTNGLIYFSEPLQANYASRYYRFRSP